MIPASADLDELRRLAGASYRYRKAQETLTAGQWLDLPPEHRKGWNWGPDRAVVDLLAEAERAHTSRVAASAAIASVSRRAS